MKIANLQVLPGLILLQKLDNPDVPIWRKVEQARVARSPDILCLKL